MNPNKMLIVCENEQCKAHFSYEHIVIQEESIASTKYVGLRHRYFVCPVCYHKYTVNVTNSALRMKIARFRTMYQAHGLMMKQKNMSEKRIKASANKLYRLQEEIRKQGEALKKELS